jgi:hypothetical protein
MIRADEIREILLTIRDPLEACKVLTERANLAGGHDNITVIVAHFDGEGLRALAPDDEPLGYRKYALPEVASADATSRSAPVSVDNVQTGPPSEEARRESRRLRVGHTMVGMTNPLAGLDLSGPQPSHPIAAPPAAFGSDDEPLQIPTTGLPPSVVGFMVLGAMLLVAVMGFFVLR